MTLGRLHATAGYHWRNGESWLVRSAHRALDVRSAVRPIYVKSASPSQSLPSLAYLGIPDGVHYTLPFLEQCRATSGDPGGTDSSVRGGQDPIEATSGPQQADLLVIGHDARWTRRLPRTGCLRLPFRVGLIVPLDARQDVLQRVSRKDRQQFRRQRDRQVWHLESAGRNADFDYFYDRMHLPTMALRHGVDTRSERRDSAYASIFRRGRLFFLRQSGERVVGALCRLEPRAGTLVIRLVGVRDGDLVHYRQGTYMALFIHLLEWATARGLARVDLGGCEPFLNKGTFRFKRKLHPHVGLPSNHFRHRRLCLTVTRDTRAVRDFLVNNPPIAIGADGRLRAVYFYDTERPPRTDLPWRTAGISEARYVGLDKFLTGDLHAS
jgi:hypothetical protein